MGNDPTDEELITLCERLKANPNNCTTTGVSKLDEALALTTPALRWSLIASIVYIRRSDVTNDTLEKLTELVKAREYLEKAAQIFRAQGSPALGDLAFDLALCTGVSLDGLPSTSMGALTGTTHAQPWNIPPDAKSPTDYATMRLAPVSYPTGNASPDLVRRMKTAGLARNSPASAKNGGAVRMLALYIPNNTKNRNGILAGLCGLAGVTVKAGNVGNILKDLDPAPKSTAIDCFLTGRRG